MRRLIFISLIFIISSVVIQAQQNRINYNNRQLFLSGSNIAWVNFAADIGPGNTNFNQFEKIFGEMHADRGNSFRFWLHTDGRVTPEFDGSGLVNGPGAGAIDDLKHILDLAEQNKIGLLLCLWSHDMMITNLLTTILNRNKKLLTDTTAIHAYINNALIPLVEGVKGHPAIIAWEIFNEPEGFTEIGNWSNRVHVTERDVQRFVNLTTGAIHRTDPAAKVTNGTWGMQALTDVTYLSKVSPTAFYNSLTNEQKRNMEAVVETKYGLHMTAQEIVNKFYSPQASNYNFYRDDRLIAAGGDLDGTLDFYTVHYYNWAGTTLSPFHHSYSGWNLNKPLAIAEFFMEDTFGVPYQNLYNQLYSTGYAGAMSWQWLGDTQANDNTKNSNHSRTSATLLSMYQNYHSDIVVNIESGTIYNYTVSPLTFQQGDTVVVSWDTEVGSVVSINGESVSVKGSKKYVPNKTTTFTLSTSGQNSSSKSITTTYLPGGKIPLNYTLNQNYPNPFNPGTIISYELPQSSHVVMKVYDLLGREIATLVNEEKTAGIYKVELNGEQLSSGVYLYKLTAGDFMQTKKMIFMK